MHSSKCLCRDECVFLHNLTRVKTQFLHVPIFLPENASWSKILLVPGHLTGMIKISVRKGDAERKEEEEGKLRVAKKASILNL